MKSSLFSYWYEKKKKKKTRVNMIIWQMLSLILNFRSKLEFDSFHEKYIAIEQVFFFAFQYNVANCFITFSAHSTHCRQICYCYRYCFFSFFFQIKQAIRKRMMYRFKRGKLNHSLKVKEKGGNLLTNCTSV